jgi:hypothetical protein
MPLGALGPHYTYWQNLVSIVIKMQLMWRKMFLMDENSSKIHLIGKINKNHNLVKNMAKSI